MKTIQQNQHLACFFQQLNNIVNTPTSSSNLATIIQPYCTVAQQRLLVK
ncbi:hypothetical protein [Shewanella algicola]|uniref:Uncharacterized protein n=1 Tax=Shewanella algicola TaxID=640633 RepID=A0A9X1ZEB8_9GAMM|nr:hypothetical protein [Shewanella algicola]MCL1105463.1 hypothetical protein [Shewanella algicola]